jgi:hypothetical protein
MTTKMALLKNESWKVCENCPVMILQEFPCNSPHKKLKYPYINDNSPYIKKSLSKHPYPGNIQPVLDFFRHLTNLFLPT